MGLQLDIFRVALYCKITNKNEVKNECMFTKGNVEPKVLNLKAFTIEILCRIYLSICKCHWFLSGEHVHARNLMQRYKRNE